MWTFLPDPPFVKNNPNQICSMSLIFKHCFHVLFVLFITEWWYWSSCVHLNSTIISLEPGWSVSLKYFSFDLSAVYSYYTPGFDVTDKYGSWEIRLHVSFFPSLYERSYYLCLNYITFLLNLQQHFVLYNLFRCNACFKWYTRYIYIYI